MSINDMIIKEMRKNSDVIMIESLDLMLFMNIDNLIKEWCFWLSYISEDEKENIKRIGAKKASKVTKKERKILDCYQEELELLKVLKKYPKKRWNDADYKLIDKYLTNSIERLILQKLFDSKRCEADELFRDIVSGSEERIADCLELASDSPKPVIRYVKFRLLQRQYRVGMQNLDRTIQAEHKRNLAMTYHDPLWELH